MRNGRPGKRGPIARRGGPPPKPTTGSAATLARPAAPLAAAMALHRAGRLEDAARAYRLLLAEDAAPAEQARLHHLIGLCRYQAGRPAAAVAPFEEAARLDPGSAAHHAALGSAEGALGRVGRALASFDRALAIDAGYPDALINRGALLLGLGRTAEALASFETAATRHPERTDAHANRAAALLRLERHDAAAAAAAHALALDPAAAEALNVRATTVLLRQAYSAATVLLNRVLRLVPGDLTAHTHRAVALQQAGVLTAALAGFRRALALEPASAEVLSNFGTALKDLGRLDEAVPLLARSQTVRPDLPKVRSNLLYSHEYWDKATPEGLFALHHGWGLWAMESWLAGEPPPTAHANPPDPARRLRVGYVSPDLYAHPCSRFIEPLLAAHDRSAVEVVCYAQVPAPDPVTARLRALADHWVPITSLTDAAVAERVRTDGIDVLVDLAGHTARHRLGVFARKPAPVQVTWLGYPDTTGISTIDARLTDSVADPPGDADRLHAETLVRLPNGFLCFRPDPDTPDPAPPPADAEGGVTFGSFNNLAKLSPSTVTVWAAILQRVPGSRLLLKSRPLGDPGVALEVRERFAKHGIDPARVDAIGWLPGTGGHLGAYGRIDVALDPFPYNGTTTTCEALWMGVPVVTRRGDRHAARVGASLLARVGLDDLVAEDSDAYVDAAVRLAADALRRRTLRVELRRRMAASALRDEAGFARDVEAAFRNLWGAWCAVRSPAAAPPPAPTVAERVAAVPVWRHRIALPDGCVTPGAEPVTGPEALRLPDRLDGLRVLDAGTGDGYWAFEAIRRGARQVVAIDEPGRPAAGFLLVRDLLDIPPDRCRREDMAIVEATPERLDGPFDLVVFAGGLPLQRHPLLALDRLAALCAGEIRIEGPILDDFSPSRGGLGRGYPDGQPVMELVRGDGRVNWLPTLHGLLHMVAAAGFVDVSGWKLVATPTDPRLCRGAVRASRLPAR